VKTLDKHVLVAKLREQIASEIAVAVRVAKDAAMAATHEDAKPENDKDMRSTEASYLARGQTERVRDLELTDNALQFLELPESRSVVAGAIAELEADDGTHVYFMAPLGGGMKTTLDGVEVQVVTPKSPLGQALLGKRAGDSVELRIKGTKREYEIVEVR
jgi:transcription elongation GreA/GreB family factor